MKLLEQFIDEKRIWWFIPVLSVTFYLYYAHLYVGIKEWHDEQLWQSNFLEISDEHYGKILVTVPKYMADFIDNTAMLSFTSATTQTVQLRLRYSDTMRVQVCADDSLPCQDTVSLNVPIGSTTVVGFSFLYGQNTKGSCYYPEVEINGRAQSTSTTIETCWDNVMGVKLWLVGNLLLPPGSNLVVPLFVMLLFGLEQELQSIMPNKNKMRNLLGLFMNLIKHNKIHGPFVTIVTLPFLLRALPTHGLKCFVGSYVLVSICVGICVGIYLNTGQDDEQTNTPNTPPSEQSPPLDREA